MAEHAPAALRVQLTAVQRASVAGDFCGCQSVDPCKCNCRNCRTAEECFSERARRVAVGCICELQNFTATNPATAEFRAAHRSLKFAGSKLSTVRRRRCSIWRTFGRTLRRERSPATAPTRAGQQATQAGRVSIVGLAQDRRLHAVHLTLVGTRWRCRAGEAGPLAIAVQVARSRRAGAARPAR